MGTTQPESAQELRHRAEEKSLLDESAAPKPLSAEEAERLLYELRVHQVELEMQKKCLWPKLDLSRC